MKNLLNKIIVKRRGLVFEEADIVKVLNAVNQRNNYYAMTNMVVANCGWADRTKWFVHFDASNEAWDAIMRELNVIRVLSNPDIPENSIGKVYTTDRA